MDHEDTGASSGGPNQDAKAEGLKGGNNEEKGTQEALFGEDSEDDMIGEVEDDGGKVSKTINTGKQIDRQKENTDADEEEDYDEDFQVKMQPRTDQKDQVVDLTLGEDGDGDEDEAEDEDEDDEDFIDRGQTTQQLNLRTLFENEGDLDEEEDDDDDFDPNNPTDDWQEDSSSDEHVSKRRREDPVRYVPPRKKFKTPGASGEVEEGSEEEVKIDVYFPQVMKQCTMIMSRVMEFLPLKERLVACSVCQAWNSPLLNFHQEMLDFSDLNNITDSQFMALLPKFIGPKIKKIKFDGCKLVTDKSLDALTIHCPLLHSLAVNRCPNITDTGLKYLTRCRNLKFLLVWGSKQVTLPTLHYLQRELHWLKTPIHSCEEDNGSSRPTFENAQVHYHAVEDLTFTGME